MPGPCAVDTHALACCAALRDAEAISGSVLSVTRGSGLAVGSWEVYRPGWASESSRPVESASGMGAQKSQPSFAKAHPLPFRAAARPRLQAYVAVAALATYEEWLTHRGSASSPNTSDCAGAEDGSRSGPASPLASAHTQLGRIGAGLTLRGEQGQSAGSCAC